MPDLYEVLGLDARATQDQVKAAFHRLAKVSHPDLDADDATAEKRFRVINHAYEILSNRGSRAAYDLGREHKRAKGHRAMGRTGKGCQVQKSHFGAYSWRTVRKLKNFG
jgi:curved DNA-binding protein